MPFELASVSTNTITISTVQAIDGNIEPNSNNLFANASTIVIGNATHTSVVSAEGVTSPYLSIGDTLDNVTINSTSFQIDSNGANTYIDGFLAQFSGIASVGGDLILNGGLNANGGLGTDGQTLTSNGSSVYWATGAGGGFSNGQSISVNNFVITGSFTANSSTGTNGQILVSNGSAVYWANNNINTQGNSAVFTANGSQTNFLLSYQPSNPKDLIVTVNGLLLVPNNHYTVNGFNVAITTAPPNNSVVEVRSIIAAPGNYASVDIVKQKFTANGTANSFTVTNGYTPGYIQVFLNGVKLEDGVEVITTSGTTVNLATAPSSNSIVEVFGPGVVTNGITTGKSIAMALIFGG